MAKINLAEELRKRGFKLTPLPPLTPKQMEDIEKVNQDVKKFLEMMDAAHRASAHSKLRFDTPIAKHSPSRHCAQKLHLKNRD